MINVTKELSVTDIKTFKEEILEEIWEIGGEDTKYA
jgi:hypothetical protein